MTIQQLVSSIILIASFLTAIATICKYFKNAINKAFEPIYHRIDKLDINQCRNYLVDFLSDIENGISKDEIQIKRAHEIYDHYTNDLKGNSYIHDKWEKLMK